MGSVSISRRVWAEIGLLYAAIIWGATFFVVKETLNDVDPVALVGYRFTLAALLLAVYLVIRRQNVLTHLKEGLVLGIILWLLYASQTIGLKYTTASNSGFITGLFVIFVPLLGLFFFRRKLNVLEVAAFIISAGGLWLLTGGIRSINPGDLITLVSALTYALHLLMADRYVKRGVDPFITSFQQFAVVALLSWAVVGMFGLPLHIANVNAIWVILFLTLFPTLSAFVIQLFAQKITSPLKVTLIFTLEPVFAAVFAWTLGNEVFVIRSALGGLLIFLAMILADIPASKR